LRSDDRPFGSDQTAVDDGAETVRARRARAAASDRSPPTGRRRRGPRTRQRPNGAAWRFAAAWASARDSTCRRRAACAACWRRGLRASTPVRRGSVARVASSCPRPDFWPAVCCTSVRSFLSYTPRWPPRARRRRFRRRGTGGVGTRLLGARRFRSLPVGGGVSAGPQLGRRRRGTAPSGPTAELRASPGTDRPRRPRPARWRRLGGIFTGQGRNSALRQARYHGVGRAAPSTPVDEGPPELWRADPCNSATVRAEALQLAAHRRLCQVRPSAPRRRRPARRRSAGEELAHIVTGHGRNRSSFALGPFRARCNST